MSEPDVSDLITVQQAIEILDAAPVEPRIQRANLPDAMGMYLGEDVRADRDYPAFEKSLMDGFAIRTSDQSQALQLVGEIRAGERSSRELTAGQAMSIMTGAPLPAGADGVVPVEFAEVREGPRDDRPAGRLLTLCRPRRQRLRGWPGRPAAWHAFGRAATGRRRDGGGQRGSSLCPAARRDPCHR